MSIIALDGEVGRASLQYYNSWHPKNATLGTNGGQLQHIIFLGKRPISITNLNYRRPSSHCIVCHRRIAARQYYIRLTADRRGTLVCRGYDDGEATFNRGGLGEDRAGDGDESGKDL